MPAELEKENAAPNASVGADAGQQFSNKYDNNIPDAGAESNENFDELKKKLRRMQDPAYLPTVTMTELYDTVYESRRERQTDAVAFRPCRKVVGR